MIVNKITSGFVTQSFDTETKKWVSQEFTAGDECQYEDQQGNAVAPALLEVDGKEAYLPFEMVDPYDDDDPICFFQCDNCGALETAPTSDVKAVGHPMCPHCTDREMDEITEEEYTKADN